MNIRTLFLMVVLSCSGPMSIQAVANSARPHKICAKNNKQAHSSKKFPLNGTEREITTAIQKLKKLSLHSTNEEVSSIHDMIANKMLLLVNLANQLKNYIELTPAIVAARTTALRRTDCGERLQAIKINLRSNLATVIGFAQIFCTAIDQCRNEALKTDLRINRDFNLRIATLNKISRAHGIKHIECFVFEEFINEELEYCPFVRY